MESLLKDGVEKVAIHRKLSRSHGYTGSYSAVRRYVAKLLPKEIPAFARIETQPGVPKHPRWSSPSASIRVHRRFRNPVSSFRPFALSAPPTKTSAL